MESFQKLFLPLLRGRRQYDFVFYNGYSIRYFVRSIRKKLTGAGSDHPAWLPHRPHLRYGNHLAQVGRLAGYALLDAVV
jgi:hypothetical protein